MSTEQALGEAILDPDLRHINFFNGRLLSGEDLTAEQAANLAEGRHLGAALGAGVATGLEVSLDASSPADDVRVKIRAGLAVSSRGQTLRLACDQTVSLVQPPDPAEESQCVFSDCSPLAAGSSLSGDGFYLLTIAPASQPEGLAPVSGLGNTPAPCNSRYFTEGVQFRLIPLNLAAIGNANRVRNEAAYQCFGVPGRSADQFVADGLQENDAASYGWETLAPSLTEDDVPLALIQWTGNGGIGFLDRWSVRRRMVPPGAAKSWDYFAAGRRRAEAEAMFEQFQEELSDLQQQSGTQALAAEQLFKYLPPAGILPVDANSFNWKTFLGAHAPSGEIPLDAAQVRAVLWEALAEEPVTVISASAAATAQPPPVPFHVYRLSAPANVILFVRSQLNEITADEVYFDNSICNLDGAATVQDAIDALCKNQDGCCTLTASPAAGWERIFDQVPAGGNASICFPAGKYPVSNSITVQQKGHLRLTGCGAGSLITAANSEAALIFSQCSSVHVSALNAQGGSSGNSGPLEHLNGTFTFLDCGSVTVEEACFSCAPAAATGAACLTVRNTSATGASGAPTRAQVCRSLFLIGGSQLGMLFVNVGRTHVENNVLRVEGRASFTQVVRSGQFAAMTKRFLVSNITAGVQKKVKRTANAKAKASAQPGNATVSYAGQVITFQTDPSLIGGSAESNVWQEAINKLQPVGITNPQKLTDYVQTLAGQLAAGEGRIENFKSPAFAKLIKQFALQPPAVACGGIWVGGTAAPEIRVLNNTMDGVLAGVHVGVSGSNEKSPDLAGMVTISGNRIGVLLPDARQAQRHGIFVGNVTSLMIENNFIACQRAAAAKGVDLQGIRIYGYLGGVALNGRIIVRANHLQGFLNIGILFAPLNAPGSARAKPALKPWVVAENLAEGADSVVQVSPAYQTLVRLTDNYS